MAFGYDGSVRIKADLNHSAFDKGLRTMTAQVQKFSGTLTKMAKLVGAAFGAAALVNFGKEAVKAASALNDAWMGLQSIVEGQGKSFSNAKSFIDDYISDGLVPLENAVTAYKNLAARGYSSEQIEKTLTALKDAAAFGRQASYSLGEAVATATEGLKNENSILVDNAGVTKNVAKMWDEYARSIGTTANKLTQAQKIEAEVNGILQETRFQTGDAAKLVGTYSGQVAMLGYNFQQLKVNVGNAIMPVVQAVLPGINAIIAGLTKLAVVFSQVTALLFGKSAKVSSAGVTSSASAAADATDQLADSLGGAGAAAKKAGKDMKSITAPFDEFNILAENAAGSLDDAAGGMAGAGSLIPEFEADTSGIEAAGEAFSSLGELFQQTLDKMLAGMPAFQEVLLGFAGQFNDFHQTVYDALTFPGISDRVSALGSEIASAFNGLVDAVDWRLWGQTLGAGIDLGLQFLSSAIYTFDWMSLGSSIAEYVNGAVSEIDWSNVGSLLWAKFKIALETFAWFFTGLDMPALAEAASRLITGFLNSMQETIAKIDWSQIGIQIAEFLNNIDWVGLITELAESFSDMVDAALELIGGFIQNADPETLAVAAGVLATLLLGKIVASVLPSLAKEIASNLISKLAAEITSSDFTSVLSSLTTKLAGIGAALVGLTISVDSFKDMWQNGFSAAEEATMLLGIALTAVGAILLGAPALVTGIIAGIVAIVATAVVWIKEHWDEVKQFFIDAWEKIKEVWSVVANWFNENVIQPIVNFFSNLWDNVKKLASDAWAGIQNVWNVVAGWFNNTIIQPVANFFSNLWSGIKKTASDLWESIKNVWKNAANWFSQHVTEPLSNAFKIAGNAIASIFNGVIGGVEWLINKLISGVNWLIDQINKIQIDVPDWVPFIGGKTFGFDISHVNEVSLPRLPKLANGAVIPPNQQFAAILGDQRSGTNVEAPLSTIRQAVTEAIQGLGGVGSNQPIQVNVMLDRKVLARAMVNEVNSMTRSAGRPVLLG